MDQKIQISSISTSDPSSDYPLQINFIVETIILSEDRYVEVVNLDDGTWEGSFRATLFDTNRNEINHIDISDVAVFADNDQIYIRHASKMKLVNNDTYIYLGGSYYRRVGYKDIAIFAILLYDKDSDEIKYVRNQEVVQNSNKNKFMSKTDSAIYFSSSPDVKRIYKFDVNSSVTKEFDFRNHTFPPGISIPPTSSICIALPKINTIVIVDRRSILVYNEDTFELISAHKASDLFPFIDMSTHLLVDEANIVGDNKLAITVTDGGLQKFNTYVVVISGDGNVSLDKEIRQGNIESIFYDKYDLQSEGSTVEADSLFFYGKSVRVSNDIYFIWSNMYIRLQSSQKKGVSFVGVYSESYGDFIDIYDVTYSGNYNVEPESYDAAFNKIISVGVDIDTEARVVNSSLYTILSDKYDTCTIDKIINNILGASTPGRSINIGNESIVNSSDIYCGKQVVVRDQITKENICEETMYGSKK